MKSGLRGRVAAVTGAAGAIGGACAEALRNEGCLVVAADIVWPDGEADVLWHPDAYRRLSADLSSRDGAHELARLAVESFGRLDILVACAGIYHTTPWDQITEEEWDRIHAVNLRGTFFCAQAALSVMVANDWGRIITVGSIAGQSGGEIAGAAYASAKAGVMGLTRSLARVAGPRGITVNCINPGIIETPMTTVMGTEAKTELARRTPLRRLGTAENVADVVVMLASEGSSFVHGAQVDVNGGLHMA